MLFLVTYQVDRDKQIECQTFFANMTDEQIENEYPTSVKQIGRWHDVPNGNGVIIVETENQENLTVEYFIIISIFPFCYCYYGDIMKSVFI